jgi:hypothetical protein|tara:strand:- start:3289 stop:3570 length:282 start_codon:yes stop_codon:yes gene_type:complete
MDTNISHLEGTMPISKKEIDKQVNSPEHYISGDLECIDAMVSIFGLKRTQDYAEIAAFKYVYRAGKKAGNPAAQDKAKNIWYTRFSMGDDPRK